MYTIPEIEECIDFAKKLGCKHILELSISESDNPAFNCHNNSAINPLIGVYFVKDASGILHAFRHSVIDAGENLIDSTPCVSGSNYRVFAYPIDNTYNYEHLTYAETCVFINKEDSRETQLMYYVYGLIDPRNGQPFYIGKGKDDRALSHYRERNLLLEGNTKKTAKIRKLKSLNFKPMVEFYATNIISEEIAYSIEESLILFYGREGYEEGGILTNICLGSRPPNFKGKSYLDIMGADKARDLTEKKRELQLKAGGYGPKKHTEETKSKIKKSLMGRSTRITTDEIKRKIGKANSGKKHNMRAKLYIVENHNSNTIDYVLSNHLQEYCNEMNYSIGTFQSQLAKGWGISKKGMNKGLKIREATLEEAQETQLTSYIIGGVKKDVSMDVLKGMSL